MKLPANLVGGDTPQTSRRNVIFTTAIGAAVASAHPLLANSVRAPVSSHIVPGLGSDDIVQYAAVNGERLVYVIYNRKTGQQTLTSGTPEGQIFWSYPVPQGTKYTKPYIISQSVILYGITKTGRFVIQHDISNGVLVRNSSDSALSLRFVTFLGDQIVSIQSDNRFYISSLNGPELVWRQHSTVQLSDFQCPEVLSSGHKIAIVDTCATEMSIYDLTNSSATRVRLRSPSITDASNEIADFRKRRMASGIPENQQPRTHILGGAFLIRNAEVCVYILPYNPAKGLNMEMFDLGGNFTKGYVLSIPAGVRSVPTQLLIYKDQMLAVFPLGNIVAYTL